MVRFFFCDYGASEHHFQITKQVGLVAWGNLPPQNVARFKSLQPGDIIVIKGRYRKGEETSRGMFYGHCVVTGKPRGPEEIAHDDLIWPDERAAGRVIWRYRVPVTFSGIPELVNLHRLTWKSFDDLNWTTVDGRLMRGPGSWGKFLSCNLVADPTRVEQLKELFGYRPGPTIVQEPGKGVATTGAGVPAADADDFSDLEDFGGDDLSDLDGFGDDFGGTLEVEGADTTSTVPADPAPSEPQILDRPSTHSASPGAPSEPAAPAQRISSDQAQLAAARKTLRRFQRQIQKLANPRFAQHDHELSFLQARILIDHEFLENPDEAYRLLDKSLKSGFCDPRCYWWLGRLALKRERWLEAVEFLGKAVAVGEAKGKRVGWQGENLYSYACLRAGKYEGVVNRLSSFLNRQYYPFIEKRAECLEVEEQRVEEYLYDSPEVVCETTECATLGLRYADALCRTGQAMFHLGRFDEAARHFSEADAHVTWLLNQSDIHGGLLWWPEGMDGCGYEHPIRATAPAYCEFWRGRCQFRLGEFEQAESSLRSAITRIESFVHPFAWDEDLSNEWDEQFRIQHVTLSASEFGLYDDALYWLGRARAAQDRHSDAFTAYCAALRHNPCHSSALHHRGRLWLHSPDRKSTLPAAMSDFVEAIYFAPSDFSAYFDFLLIVLGSEETDSIQQAVTSGNLYRGSFYHEAIAPVLETAVRVLRQQSQDITGSLRHGCEAAAKGLFSAAERHFAKLTAADSGNAFWHLLLGAVHHEAGRLGQAESEFQDAVTLAPHVSMYRFALSGTQRRAGLYDQAAREELKAKECRQAQPSSMFAHVVEENRAGNVLFRPVAPEARTQVGIPAKSLLPGQSACITGFQSPIRSMSLSNDLGLLATGHSDGTLSLWSLAEGEEVRRCAGAGRIETFTPDSRYLIGTNGCSVLIWDTSTWAKACELRHDSDITSVSVAPDSSRLTVTTKSEWRSVWVWDLSRLVVLYTFPWASQSAGLLTSYKSRDMYVARAVPYSSGREDTLDIVEVWQRQDDGKYGVGSANIMMQTKEVLCTPADMWFSGLLDCYAAGDRVVALAERSGSSLAWYMFQHVGEFLEFLSVGMEVKSVKFRGAYWKAQSISSEGRCICSPSSVSSDGRYICSMVEMDLPPPSANAYVIQDCVEKKEIALNVRLPDVSEMALPAFSSESRSVALVTGVDSIGIWSLDDWFESAGKPLAPGDEGRE